MSTTTTITLPTGHRFDYSQDIDVINPFDDTGHCEPPIAVVNLDVRGQEAIDNYAGEELNLNTLLSRPQIPRRQNPPRSLILTPTKTATP